MSIYSALRAFAIRQGGLSRYVPFLNRVRMGGGRLRCGGLLWRTRISCSGSGNTIEISEGCVLRDCRITVQGNGNRVIIRPGVHANQADIWLEDDNNVVTIGENTLLCGKIHLACTEGTAITFGRDCLCSSDIVVRTGDSHSIVDGAGRRLNPARSVTIGNHVWIGYHAWLTKGAQIPDDSVVGTAAVVTKAFAQKGVVLAGNPAKVIREGVNWCVEHLPTPDDCGASVLPEKEEGNS